MNKITIYPMNVRSKFLLGYKSKFSFCTEKEPPFGFYNEIFEVVMKEIETAFKNHPLYFGKIGDTNYDYDFYVPEHFGVLVVAMKYFPYTNEESSSLILTFKTFVEYYVEE